MITEVLLRDVLGQVMQILLLAVVSIIGLLAASVLARLKERLGLETTQRLDNIINDVVEETVLGVEQIAQAGGENTAKASGVDKKEIAIKVAVSQLASMGVTTSREVVSNKIEGILGKYSNKVGKFLSKI